MPPTSSLPATSQAYRIRPNNPSHSHLSPTLLSNLSLETSSLPTPGPNSVLVRLHSAALNYRDILVLADSPLYPTRTIPGLTPCTDGAGEIVSAGPGSVWASSIGTSVLLVPIREWIDGDVEAVDMHNSLGSGDVDGTLAQYTVVQDPWVVRAPNNLKWEERASLPGAAITAVNVLESIHVTKGTTVVTQGTGGVSCFVIQVAAALGARVIATSSTDEKLGIAKQLGAAEVVNYRTTPDWAGEVLKLTGGRGVDLVCDVAGSGTLEASMRALRQGGLCCVVGFLTPTKPVDVVMPLIAGGKTLKGILGGSRKMLERVVELVEEHDLHPCIGHVYEWGEAPQAFERLRKQDFVGKLVVKV